MRAQLLSAEHMERQGRLLARAHKLRDGIPADRLLGRLTDNQQVIDDACALFNAAAQANRRLTPACEWLLDNASVDMPAEVVAFLEAITTEKF